MKYLKTLLFFLVYILFITDVNAKTVNVYLFHNEDCIHCKQEIEYLEELEKKYDINVLKYEVSHNAKNQELLTKVRNLLKNDKNEVPFTVIGEYTYTGFNFINKAQIEERIKYYNENDYCDAVGAYLGLTESCGGIEKPSDEDIKPVDLGIFGKVDLKNVSLPIISVIIGFVDGFNPCAMWVLIFLLSMLIGMKDRKKMWILGLTFIISSAAVYLLIMLAWLNLVVQFTTIRALQIVIAVFALIAAAINLRSYFKSLKKDDGCTVTTSNSRKKIITKIKRIVTLEELSESKKKFAFLLAIFGIIALAISVNVIELACSAGLPLIFTQILAMNDVTSLARIIYILIYILFFMIDDLIIFTIAMFTFKITGISTKYTKYSHLIGGIIMLIIAILMIFKPEWIMFNF